MTLRSAAAVCLALFAAACDSNGGAPDSGPPPPRSDASSEAGSCHIAPSRTRLCDDAGPTDGGVADATTTDAAPADAMVVDAIAPPTGACPVVTDVEMLCDTAASKVDIAAGPGDTGHVLFVTPGSSPTSGASEYHIHLAALDATGNATFAVDPIPLGSDRSISLGADAQGEPRLTRQTLTTVGDASGQAVEYFARTGGKFVGEEVVSALSSASLVDAVVAPDGRAYALLTVGNGGGLGLAIASRAASGGWSQQSIGMGNLFDSAIALDGAGQPIAAFAGQPYRYARLGSPAQDAPGLTLDGQYSEISLAAADGTMAPVVSTSSIVMGSPPKAGLIAFRGGAYENIPTIERVTTGSCPTGAPPFCACNGGERCSVRGRDVLAVALTQTADGTIWAVLKAITVAQDLVVVKTTGVGGCSCDAKVLADFGGGVELAIARVPMTKGAPLDVRFRAPVSAASMQESVTMKVVPQGNLLRVVMQYQVNGGYRHAVFDTRVLQ